MDGPRSETLKKKRFLYNEILTGGFKYFYFHLYLGKWSNLTNIFQVGWNDQLDYNEIAQSLTPSWKENLAMMWGIHWVQGRVHVGHSAAG